MILTPTAIYQTAINAGFPSDIATQMTAIALRESGGNADATNISQTEKSYGLWQINIQGNPGLMSRLGISDPNQLLDPNVNAQAAYLLYGGNPNNLNVAWYINQPGYQQSYQAYLPVAYAAADSVNNPFPSMGIPGLTFDTGSSSSDVTAGLVPSGMDWGLLLLVGFGLVVIWKVMGN